MSFVDQVFIVDRRNHLIVVSFREQFSLVEWHSNERHSHLPTDRTITTQNYTFEHDDTNESCSSLFTIAYSTKSGQKKVISEHNRTQFSKTKLFFLRNDSSTKGIVLEWVSDHPKSIRSCRWSNIGENVSLYDVLSSILSIGLTSIESAHPASVWIEIEWIRKDSLEFLLLSIYSSHANLVSTTRSRSNSSLSHLLLSSFISLSWSSTIDMDTTHSSLQSHSQFQIENTQKCVH